MGVITLRTATRDDISILADVLANVQAQTDPSVDVDACRQALVGSINRDFGHDEPESLLSVIEVDGAPAGRLRVVRFSDRIFLGGIQIHPDFQRNGIGSHLIGELIAESRSVGSPLELNVERDNTDALRLYERLGMIRQGESGRDIKMAYLPTDT